MQYKHLRKERLEIIEHYPSSPGIDGHGEGLVVNGRSYYYSKPKIPLNKPVLVMNESNYCGRVNGEKDYLVIYRESDTEFYVLDRLWSGKVRETMRKYKTWSLDDFDNMIQERKRFSENHYDKCSICGKDVLRLDEIQPKNMCWSCYKKKLEGTQS